MWVRLTDVAAVTVTVTGVVVTRLVSALAWAGATPGSAVVAETAKAKSTLTVVSRYIVDQFLTGTRDEMVSGSQGNIIAQDDSDVFITSKTLKARHRAAQVNQSASETYS